MYSLIRRGERLTTRREGRTGHHVLADATGRSGALRNYSSHLADSGTLPSRLGGKQYTGG